MTAVSPLDVTAAAGQAAPGRVFPLLDGYRALAATAVVLTHIGFQTGAAINGTFAAVLARLDLGVALFFLISGFLLFRPYARRYLLAAAPPPAKPYLLRRALRVLPAFWLAVAGAWLIVPQTEPIPGTDWLAQVFLLQIYLPDSQVLGLTPMWSLATEVAFYSALPFVGVLLARLPRRTVHQRMRLLVGLLAVLALVAQTFRVLAHLEVVHSAEALLWLPAYLDWFAAGMLLAAVHTYLDVGPHDGRWTLLRDVAFAPGACWAAAACLGWIATTEIAGPRSLELPTYWESAAKHLLYAGIAFFLLLPGVFGPSREGVIRRWLGSRPMVFLGEISYGIFLWNMPLLLAVFGWLDLKLFGGRFLFVLAIVYPATLVAAALSYRLVEHPLSRLRNRVSGPREAGAAASPRS